MRTQLLKALTLIVAVGFIVGATVAAGGDKSKKANVKPAPEAKADAGQKAPPPTFLPGTKAAMPMHLEEPAPNAAPQPAPQKALPQQAAPTQQATP